ncbi:MAG: serine--tRNA ligase [Hydrotalea flava]|uniref:serine--tRNA ligase n=1 Tax=Hydrotalea lipotrueae TaxID=2803817 RepID=UPI00169CFA95|nr:serine--tRNA ligase [Hydrotalea lipotrueae]NIM35015.1 serine--tRNA ligase [Hydrotalea flava]NIM37841.1 serine--tRNA ligase [Hydrotalea flava]NIN03010.1 serine--tRNA ligase [Hydrotalea flava]NIN14695.1 serine--tRNA ligase [Hydrotalea flava]NIO93767.1 serine--tRNA ligase [Hydrotalea flava]
MLQVQVLRNNPEWVKERLALKQFKQPELVDEIIALDDLRRKTQAQFDAVQAQANAAAKEIGKLMAQGQKEAAETMKANVSNLKQEAGALSNALTETEKKLQEKIIQLPNLPAAIVPPGRSADDNEIVKTGGSMPQLPENALPHWELIKQYDLIDFETGAKITGSGFPLYKGKGAKLQRALVQYFLDENTAAGYTEYIPPFMVNEASAYGTGQLPDKEGQMYHATEDNFYLIPTAEVPVTNIYRDTILREEELPIKMTAYSPCFRREAGSFGKDVRGLNRLHQFEKVEIIQIVHPDNSYATLDAMVNHVERLLQLLELPYRILRLCGGDMGFTSALTYDFEVFSAAQQRWLEVSSVSNFESFQTNRLKCRFKDATGKTQLAHSLNGSALALPRIVAALLENNQNYNGIALPKVLHRYFGAEALV